MKRFDWLVIVLLAMPLSATAGLFGIGSTDKAATEVAALEEDTQAGTLDFSPDGRHLAVDSYGNGGTDIWDVEQKQIVKHLPEGGTGTWYIELIRYSPNGQQLAICHGGRGDLEINIDVYDTSTWTKVHSIGDGKQAVGGGCAGIAYTPDGKELIRLADRDIFHPGNNVMFYDTSTWQLTKGIRTMPLVESNAPRGVDRLDTNTWSLLAAPDMLLTNPGNNNAVFFSNTLSISADGKYLALAGRSVTYQHGTPILIDQPEVIVIELSNRSLFHVFAGLADSIDWNPDNVHIAAGLDDRNDTVKVFNSHTGEAVAFEAAGPAHVIVRYTPDGKYLIEKVGKQVEIWDGQHQKLLQVIKSNPSCIAVSRDGHYFAMGGAKNSILDATAMLSLITHPNGPSGKVLVYKLQ